MDFTMKKIFLILLFALLTISLFASFSEETSDFYFYNENDYEKDFEYLNVALKDASSDSEKAQILWRLSRTKLTITDEEKDKGLLSKDQLLAAYGDYSAKDKPSSDDTSSAFYYAYTSLQLEETPNGYHWLSSAVGRCGQVHGALNSLGKAAGMRDLEMKALEDFSSFDLETDSWYVLGILYKSLPGSPISFGNTNVAISFMRKCLATMDFTNRTNGTNYLELAEQLYERGWSQSKRSKEFQSFLKLYNKAVQKKSGYVEINRYYEGYANELGEPFYVKARLDQMSDKTEALSLLEYAKLVINMRLPYAKSTLNKEKMEAELEKINAKLEEWK